MKRLDNFVACWLWNRTPWPLEAAPRWVRLYAKLRPNFMIGGRPKVVAVDDD